MSTKHQKIIIPIPKGYSEFERERISRDIIEAIQINARNGLDADGKPFKGGYTEAYKKSLDFKIGGKSPGKVDMTLSGDMLGAIDLLKNGNGKLVIGFEKGSDENARADGNIRGTYGQSKPIPGKARNFLGIPEAQLKAILRRYPLEADRTRTETITRGVERELFFQGYSGTPVFTEDLGDE